MPSPLLEALARGEAATDTLEIEQDEATQVITTHASSLPGPAAVPSMGSKRARTVALLLATLLSTGCPQGDPGVGKSAESPVAEGQGAATVASVVSGPEWFLALPPEQRAPYPLPDILRFGEQPGEFINSLDGSVLVWVLAGSFEMGSEGRDSSKPVRTITFEQGFWIGKHEVTWAQYQRWCEAHGHPAVQPGFPVDGDHPVHGVSWEQADQYCAAMGLELPTEAQWEYAARGAVASRFPWGNGAPSPELLNAEGEADGFPQTAPVGSFPQGSATCGALDLAGNVSEWVRDRYRFSYPEGPTDGSAVTRGNGHVVRGGAWSSEAQDCESFRRAGLGGADEGMHWLGFRVALTR
jgi:hypothetical protein